MQPRARSLSSPRPLLQSPRRGRKNEGNWAVSYVDLLTLLLSFFIIFFNAEKITAKPDEDALRKIAISVGGTRAANDVPGRGLASATDPPDGKSPSVMESLLKNMKSDETIRIHRDGRQLSIEFPETAFFSSGATELLQPGSEKITELVQLLRPYRSLVRVTVQGYTDARNPKQDGRRNYSDNWELSVLRATAVLKFFIQSDFSPKSLSAEGFAETRNDSLASRDPASQRRVTIQIQEKETQEIQ
jgi:chemotaxis protein MotB